jgi:CRP-like cAMP-binding protein
MAENIQMAKDFQDLLTLLHEHPGLKEFREAMANPQGLEDLAKQAKFELLEFSGQKVISQHEKANGFYLVLTGQLRAVDIQDNGRPKLLNYLVPGDFFGMRSLFYRGEPQRMVTIEVVTRSKVAFFERRVWDWLITNYPEVYAYFQKVESRRISQASEDFPGRQPDEVVVISTKRHVVAFIATLPLPLTLLIAPLIFLLAAELLGIRFEVLLLNILTWIATLPFIIIALLLIIYNYFDWRNDDLIVTTKRVIHIERVLFYGERRRDAPLARVQDVTTLSDIFDLVFDSDSLRITTAGAGSIEIHHIRKADRVRQAILAQAEHAKARVAEADVSALQKNIANQLNWGDELPKNVMAVAEEEWNDGTTTKNQTHHYAGAIDYFIPRVMEVDQVGGGTVVTWRKHRYVLLVNVIVPTLILLISSYLLVAFALVFPLQLIVGIAILGSLFWYIWAYDDWHKDLYQVTDTQIIDIESAAFRLRRTRRDGSFDSIQNVYTEIPNLFYKLLNMGNVIIETAGSEDTFTFRKVYDPAAVNKEIFNRWSLYQQRKRIKDREATTKQVMDVLKEYHRLSQKISHK